MTPPPRRLALYLLPLLALLLAAALLFTPVTVRGPSMAPALEEGSVLVTVPTWLRQPRRLDLVVFEEPDSGDTAVKRVGGLPGERVMLLQGDLQVDGAPAPRELKRAEDLVPLVDARGAALREHFQLDLPSNDFAPLGEEWLLRGGEAFLRKVPLDGFLAGGVLRPGERPASDLGISAEFAFSRPADRFHLSLVAGKSTYVLAVAMPGGTVEYRLSRWTGRGSSAAEQLLASARGGTEMPSGVLFLAKVDRRLHGGMGGRALFAPVAQDPADALAQVGADLLGPPVEQAAIGGAGEVRVGRVRVGRDFFWAASGTHGCGAELQLAENEYYLLGDNSPESRDSRHYGPVSRDRIRGTVLGRHAPGAAGRAAGGGGR